MKYNNCMKILLKDIMDERKLTSRQLEVMSGVSKSTINGICNGTMPRIDTLEMLAKGLKIHIPELYESDLK